MDDKGSKSERSGIRKTFGRSQPRLSDQGDPPPSSTSLACDDTRGPVPPPAPTPERKRDRFLNAIHGKFGSKSRLTSPAPEPNKFVATGDSDSLAKERLDSAGTTVQHAKAAFDALGLAPRVVTTGVDKGDHVVVAGTSVLKTIDPLLKNLKVFHKATETLASVHPYAKIALCIFTFASKMIEKQLERDDKIGTLLDTMSRTYDIIRVASQDEIVPELQPRLQSQKQVLEALTTLTIHCGNYITKYCWNASFAARIVKNTLKDDSSRIELYMMSFEQLRKDLDSHAIIITQRVILQTEEEIIQIKGGVLEIKANLEGIDQKLNQLHNDFKIRDMVCAKGAGFNTEKECLSGTRAELITEILEWINSPNSKMNGGKEQTNPNPHQSIFWLHGVAGSGKSAVAHTIGHILSRIHQLGSFFCFDINQEADLRHVKIFRTITADLADQYPAFKLALAPAIDHDLCGTNDLSRQWKNLLLEPAHKAENSFEGPIVIIIDALDESGDSTTRTKLLSLLVSGAHELPSNFRFLVTSRTLPDICKIMFNSSSVLSKDITAFDVDHDITAYFQFHLGELDSVYFNHSQITWLTKRAGGLFLWAYLACEFIKVSDYAGNTPKEQFEDLAKIEPYSDNPEKNLKGIYSTILDQVFGKSGERARNRFCLVIGFILAATQPVTISQLVHLLQYYDPAKSYKDTVEPVLKYMGALLSGITTDDIPIRPLHASFREFLTQDKTSNQFYIDIKQANGYLAQAALKILSNELKFNICNLESSYIANTAVKGLQERINNISFALRYSCHNWATHLCNSSTHSSSSVLSIYVTEFTNSHLLFWIEVLSLEDKLQVASDELNNLLLWLEKIQYLPDIALLTHDTLKFLRVFGTAIRHSTPHLYLSVLSFSPELSSFRDKYNNFFHQIPRIINGWEQTWPLNQAVIQTDSCVQSFAISPDGKQIVTTSSYSLQLWNGLTYELVGQLLDGHTGFVNSTAFSSDGKKIVSGSHDKTICLWDTEKQEILAQIQGHTGGVQSVVFAPDGKTIVSGSDDGTICYWSVETQELIGQPLQEHTDCVYSVAFSPDGKTIVSGSSDNTLCIWDIERHDLIGQPLRGHTDWIRSVAFAPDGKTIVSGSHDCKICIWDVEKQELIGQLLQGHTHLVCSVAFSPDGKTIVSGSWDKTVCVWDVEKHKQIGQPLQGHTDWIHSVSFSPDGKTVLSGSDDRTIHIWDVERPELMNHSFQSLGTYHLQSVAASPDGKTAVSGNANGIIHIWDIEQQKNIAQLQGHTGYVITSVAISPDSKKIVSGSSDNTLCIWDAEKYVLIGQPLQGHTNCVRSVAFAPDGKSIVSGSDDCKICIWDVEKQELIGQPLQGHTSSVCSVAFSPDGKTIVSGSRDETVCVWDVEKHKQIGQPIQWHTNWVQSVAFSPKGTMIVSGSYDGTICICDVEKQELIGHPLEGHTNVVQSVAFSPDGKTIVSGSWDKTVRVWDVEKHKQIGQPLQGHSGFIQSVAFTPDGKIISGSDDSTIRIWNTNIHDDIRNHQESKMVTTSLIPSTADGLEEMLSQCIAFSNNLKHALNDLISFLEDNSSSESHDSSSSDAHDSLPPIIYMNKEGWIIGPENRLLLWIPLSYRKGLIWNCGLGTFGIPNVELDLSDFAHGKEWTKCYKGNS
ncbi:hypothetical protein M422DRAFT_270371 [Sphaerobolus stellatus SS14]|uniref:WD40 repeat-like protein n=1 Tax=Sphaerobolus stellatus (strain SS14) TaxID=990650 RepID=A0A0C9USR6_SPHS4|nr:hypothetical protein M422DRAFT_270371 [Sphaerobolus stellatus SS14]